MVVNRSRRVWRGDTRSFYRKVPSQEALRLGETAGQPAFSGWCRTPLLRSATVVESLSAPAWGTVPDWVGATATALTLLGFSVALIREIQQRRRDELRVADERRDNEANQARLVFTAAPHDGSPTQVRFKIRNVSTGPVFGVGVELLRGDAVVTARVAKASDRHHRPPEEISPGEEKEMWLTLQDGEPPMAGGEEFWLRLTFTDTEGRRWRRVENGQPERVTG